MAVNIENKIEIWQNKLLDLGKRNKLLNYKETKRSTLRIITPEIYEFWDSFVKNEKPLEFPFYDDIEDEEEPTLFSNVETNQSIKDTQKTLRNLRDKAKTATEEQGINVLYLSFGFLEWNESKDSEQFFRSPLILVPVTLTVESISSPYILSLHEDEILLNPTLQYKLGNDFGISLPEFDEDKDLQGYFAEINALVSHNRWKVIEETGLSLLSFLKINMYNDLSNHRDSIIRNPIVRTISGDVSASNPIPEEINDYDFDAKTKPIDVFQVVDADSSQQDAILCAKKGISFVLQGPPGTGKSQTITNIIAECLADGKKVLFVSEKMAALDVVYRRLAAAGLNDFCLVLHSYKANKKAVLEQLETVLNLAKKKAELSDEVYLKLDTLKRDREKLNQYANELFTKVQPLGKSIYEVNGILANLNEYKDVIFPIENIEKADWNQYSRYVYVLNEFVNSIGKMSEDYSANPWHGANVLNVSNELRHDIGATLPKLSDKIKKYQSQFQKIRQEMSLNFPISYSSIEKIIELLKVAKNSPIIPAQWILGADIKQLFDETKQVELLQDNFLENREILSVIYQRFSGFSCNLTLLDVDTLRDYADIEKERNNVHQFIQAHPVYSKIFEMNNYNDLVEKIQLTKEKTEQIQAIQKELLTVFEHKIFDVDYTSIAKADKLQASIVFCNLKPNYISSKSQRLEIYNLMANKIHGQPIMESIQNYDQKFAKKLIEVKEENTDLKARNCPIPFAEILNSDNDTIILNEIEKIKLYIKENPIYRNIREMGTVESLKKEIDCATPKIERALEIQHRILENFETEIFSIEWDAILARYRTEYTSVLKFLKGAYRVDRKQLQAIYKNTSEKMTDTIILNVLVLLKEFFEIRQWLNLSCKNIQHVFGELFCLEQTDLTLMVKQLEIYAMLEKNIVSLAELEDIALKSQEVENELICRYLCLCRKEVEDAKQWIGEKCTDLSATFQNVFKQENTDFSLIDQYIDIFRILLDIVSQLNILYEIALQNREIEPNLIAQYSFLYNGLDTSWENIRESLTWGVSFRKAVEENHLSQEFVEKICENKEIVGCCEGYEQNFIQMIQDIDVEFHWFAKLFDDADELKSTEFSGLIERINQCNNGIFLLEEWIDFRNARKNCREEGLTEYIEKIEEEKIAPSYILPIFQKRFFRLWLDDILPNYPAILNFRRINQENTIREFASLDKIQFEIAKARIKSKLINDLPSFDHFTSGVDEISILKRELYKRRKIMPIRKLFQQIPNLLPALKPCLMMSPLSVSLFLEAETYQFDTVIFDEASQVCTENAIGAISRGKQVIIAGDSKQLPPTNFFGASLSDTDYDTDDDEEDDGYAYESVLDEANLLPERPLLWHYRSRHEHLIAFSNAKIYKNELITFPSNVDKVSDNGVEYEYVRDGFYDRGGKKGNVIEAKRVAEIVFENFKKYPNRSIGVIAFGEVQQQAIDTAIRKMRMENQMFESFFNEDKEEPFFVKNLENVQGDERDTIVFSIGYAKDASGVFRMNFGPLSKTGGERRLNVAITRAKYNVKLVGSILPTDINIEKISSDGPKLLKAYIDFAINGVDSLSREITESDIVAHDSPFEKAVYNFLDRKGHKLGTQVGCSGYRIDMAVKHPTLSGQYVLGIECDGAAYHSARTARERDRLRQDVLEQMGWKIYRIWSTDWIKDPVTEGEKLIEAVEDALKNYAVPYEEVLKTDLPKADDFVSIEKKNISVEEQLNPYGFEEEKLVSFSDLPRNYSGYLSIEDCIVEVVKQRFPIHYDLLCKELAPLFGNEKATVKVKREVDYGLSKLGKRIIIKDNFLYPCNYEKITPRQDNTRKIDYVATEELAEAMLSVLDKCIGATKETLCTETARAYNYNRITEKISSAMDRSFELLLQENHVEILEGKVVQVE